VCSDQTVSSADSLTEIASELGIDTTTDASVISKFLASRNESPRVIFSTYQSSPKVAQALAKSRATKFDLVICDEAHKTVGVGKGPFATVLHDHKIRAARRLFLTATPRIYGANLKAKSQEQGWTLLSMDDERVYGPVVHRLSFGDAIQKKLLCDYRVVVMSISDAEINAAICDRALLRSESGTIDAESLAGHVAVGKAIKRFRLRKVITFHQRIASARMFADLAPN
jgi:predicted helicase